MNKVILMGRLTRDPEVRYSNGDNATAIARFSIAVDRRFKRGNDGQDADFFNCTAFGKQGEFVEKYLKKGTKILLSGRIQNDNYTNRDGQKVSSVQMNRLFFPWKYPLPLLKAKKSFLQIPSAA